MYKIKHEDDTNQAEKPNTSISSESSDDLSSDSTCCCSFKTEIAGFNVDTCKNKEEEYRTVCSKNVNKCILNRQASFYVERGVFKTDAVFDFPGCREERGSVLEEMSSVIGERTVCDSENRDDKFCGVLDKRAGDYNLENKDNLVMDIEKIQDERKINNLENEIIGNYNYVDESKIIANNISEDKIKTNINNKDENSKIIIIENKINPIENKIKTNSKYKDENSKISIIENEIANYCKENIFSNKMCNKSKFINIKDVQNNIINNLKTSDREKTKSSKENTNKKSDKSDKENRKPTNTATSTNSSIDNESNQREDNYLTQASEQESKLPVFPIFALEIKDEYVIAGGGGGDPAYGKLNGVVVYDLTTYKGIAFINTEDVIDRIEVWTEGEEYLYRIEEMLDELSETEESQRDEMSYKMNRNDNQDLDYSNDNEIVTDTTRSSNDHESVQSSNKIEDSYKDNNREENNKETNKEENNKDNNIEDNKEDNNRDNNKEENNKLQESSNNKHNNKEDNKEDNNKDNNREENNKLQESSNNIEDNNKEDNKEDNNKENNREENNKLEESSNNKEDNNKVKNSNLPENNKKQDNSNYSSSKRKTEEKSSSTRIILLATGLHNLYLILLENEKLSILNKYPHRIENIFCDEITILTKKEAIYGYTSPFNIEMYKKPKIKHNPNNNLGFDSTHEEYFYTMFKKDTRLSFHREDMSTDILDNWHSFFVQKRKIHKIIKEDNSYVFVFEGKKYKYRDEICNIKYMSSTKELLFFVKSVDESKVVFITGDNKKEVYIEKITALSTDQERVVVGTGMGEVYIFDQERRYIKKKVTDLPLTGVGLYRDYVYFTSFNGLIDRRRISRGRSRVFMVLLLALVTVIVAIIVKRRRSEQ